ncbi:MAG: sigma-70 family RNA polymerase sigma factor [Rikenellaceae bacterium]|nr:sigma-70 family RNA polymerase sigma factor [Rikenellaceae bacterium]
MEREQFIGIIQENKNLIYKICRTYCSGPELRKDLEQEIIMNLWNSFEKFDGRVKISTWMYRVALNTAISFYRREKKHQEKKTSIDTNILVYPAEYDSEHEAHIKILYRFIDRQNQLDKALILLYLDNIKYSEIASILGISETNVATKISRIKNKLREQITSEKI